MAQSHCPAGAPFHMGIFHHGTSGLLASLDNIFLICLDSVSGSHFQTLFAATINPSKLGHSICDLRSGSQTMPQLDCNLYPSHSPPFVSPFNETCAIFCHKNHSSHWGHGTGWICAEGNRLLNDRCLYDVAFLLLEGCRFEVIIMPGHS